MGENGQQQNQGQAAQGQAQAVAAPAPQNGGLDPAAFQRLAEKLEVVTVKAAGLDPECTRYIRMDYDAYAQTAAPEQRLPFDDWLEQAHREGKLQRFAPSAGNPGSTSTAVPGPSGVQSTPTQTVHGQVDERTLAAVPPGQWATVGRDLAQRNLPPGWRW